MQKAKYKQQACRQADAIKDAKASKGHDIIMAFIERGIRLNTRARGVEDAK